MEQVSLSCKKVSFATEKDAEFYIKKLKATSKRDVVPMRSYLCEVCFRWHLTHLQAIDVLAFQKEHEKMKEKIVGFEKRVSELVFKCEDRGQTIKMLNDAIREFRMPKQRRK